MPALNIILENSICLENKSKTLKNPVFWISKQIKPDNTGSQYHYIYNHEAFTFLARSLDRDFMYNREKWNSNSWARASQYRLCCLEGTLYRKARAPLFAFHYSPIAHRAKWGFLTHSPELVEHMLFHSQKHQYIRSTGLFLLSLALLICHRSKQCWMRGCSCFMYTLTCTYLSVTITSTVRSSFVR